MKTLSEHNKATSNRRWEGCSYDAGVRCDKCGTEMKYLFKFDIPFPIDVRCPKCGYEGVMEA